jgi:hypothetical protein
MGLRLIVNWNNRRFGELGERGNKTEIHMHLYTTTAAAIVLATSVAYAQDMPAQSGPQNPAIKSTDQNNSATPVAGANSFTLSEARSKIEAKGYSHVHKLRKGPDGVWRATAMKDGKTGPVSVDYQGNVN